MQLQLTTIQLQLLQLTNAITTLTNTIITTVTIYQSNCILMQLQPT